MVFCTDKEREKAKERYIKATLKLHEHHNEYVLSVKAAQVHHQLHYGQSHPALLGALQTLQEEMVLILWVNINNIITVTVYCEIIVVSIGLYGFRFFLPFDFISIHDSVR